MKKSKAGKDVKKDTSQPLWRHITENIECLAIAIVMALILKFFLIEAYKIPTGSMQPTIMGNAEQGLFDRVLVNKFIYLFSDPERWDVIVFKYPLNQSKNYIKRLIGLPGEKITIKDGDIYANDAICRKPENALEAVLKQVFPTDRKGETIKSFFEVEGPGQAEAVDRVVFTGPGRLVNSKPIRSHYLDGYDPDFHIPLPGISIDQQQPVGDIRVAFEATLEKADGALEVVISEEGRDHRFYLRGKDHALNTSLTTGLSGAGTLGSDLGGSDSGPSDSWADRETFLEAGRAYDLVFTHVDDRLTLAIDGDTVAILDYEKKEAVGRRRSTNQVAFGPKGCGAVIEEIKLYRDIYYLGGQDGNGPVSYPVPEGHYFALGDNTQNSADSRLWNASVFTLKNGKQVKGNYDPVRQFRPFKEANPRRVQDGFILEDIYGDQVSVAIADLEKPQYQTLPEHFIHEKLMLGKAMVVFWPIYPHFRWKLLR